MSLIYVFIYRFTMWWSQKGGIGFAVTQSQTDFMHLSMLSCWGGRPGIGGGFELRSFFLFKCPTPGTLSLVKRVQIPHPPPPPEKGQGIGQTRNKIGIYRPPGLNE